jgi:arylsulfatase A-like enzyme
MVSSTCDYGSPFVSSVDKGNIFGTQFHPEKSSRAGRQLIENFCNHLKAEGLYDEALILITGDHGEEFMEFGHYFHGTDLCLPQSHVPLIYKFPKNKDKEVKKKLTSHVDIFPSIFDLIGLEFPSKFFHGSSIFSKKNSFIISFRPHHKKDPFQFYLHTGTEKLEAKFVNSENIYKSKAIEITSIKNSDETLKELEQPHQMNNFIMDHFKTPLNLLFGSS